ncbi:MAG: PEP-CTERM sorting domain-containing protein [Vicinamibacteraceae bacterium]|nr:PEP-CTERM sorting domain-containing protein [Vicinamibacteraceae bacterium]
MPLKTLACVLLLVSLPASRAGAEPFLSQAFSLSFAASQSLWEGGPTAGLDASGRTSGNVGLYYEVRANSGTVNAAQDGWLTASYPSQVALGSQASIGLQFTGQPNGGRVEALFGASAETGVFLDVSGCIGAVVLGTCVGVPYNVDTDIAVIDEGFFLAPTTVHTPVVDMTRSAGDADQAFGVGAGPSLGPYHLGPSMNLDLEQRVFFTPTGLGGIACYQHRDTADGACVPFDVATSGVSMLDLALGLGTWDISFLDLTLLNRFRNDIDLELRPSFDYGVGSWPPVGQELFAFGLIDETFSLDFNRVVRAGAVTITVVDRVGHVPEPAMLLLVGAGVLAGAYRRRRVM